MQACGLPRWSRALRSLRISTSDLDPALRARYGIEVVPLFVNFGTQSYRDTVDLSRDEFYAKLVAEKELPTTTQPTAHDVREMLFRPHDRGRQDGRLSDDHGEPFGDDQCRGRGCRGRFPPVAVHVVDSESVTGGLALQAIRAADLARTGVGVDAILDALVPPTSARQRPDTRRSPICRTR